VCADQTLRIYDEELGGPGLAKPEPPSLVELEVIPDQSR